MFTAKTDKIHNLSEKHSKVIPELESLLIGNVYVYIDYANVRPWSEKLKWHIDLKRLKQFLDSFDTVEAINFYNGYLAGDERSEREKTEAENYKYILRTKPVKILNFSINASSVPADSTT